MRAINFEAPGRESYRFIKAKWGHPHVFNICDPYRVDTIFLPLVSVQKKTAMWLSTQVYFFVVVVVMFCKVFGHGFCDTLAWHLFAQLDSLVRLVAISFSYILISEPKKLLYEDFQKGYFFLSNKRIFAKEKNLPHTVEKEFSFKRIIYFRVWSSTLDLCRNDISSLFKKYDKSTPSHLRK